MAEVNPHSQRTRFQSRIIVIVTVVVLAYVVSFGPAIYVFMRIFGKSEGPKSVLQFVYAPHFAVADASWTYYKYMAWWTGEYQYLDHQGPDQMP